MKYVGLIRSGSEQESVTTLTSQEPLDRLLPVETGYISGFLVNQSSSDIFVNFFVTRRESTRIVLLAGESIEVRNQPCDRLQVTPINDLTTVEIEYIFNLLQADTDIENVELLSYSNIQKKTRFNSGTSTRFQLYPTLAPATPGTTIGDIFKRGVLSINDYPLLYNTAGAGTISIQGNAYCNLQLPLQANIDIFGRAEQTAIYNQSVDPLFEIRRLICSIKCGTDFNAQGMQIMHGWSALNIGWTQPVAVIPSFGIIKRVADTNWHLWTASGQELTYADTGVDVDQYPIVSCVFIWTVDNMEARLLDFDNRILFRTMLPTFVSQIQSALCLQLSLIRDGYDGAYSTQVYSWNVEVS